MKFLVVDDHALIREALRGVLVELQRDAVVLEAGTCGEAMALIHQHADLSLLLLDLKLPDRDGFDAMAELRDHHPALSVVMLSAFNDRDNVIKALDGGALGFIPKTGSRDVLVSALRLILAGGVYIPPDILNRAPPHGRGAGRAGCCRTADVAGRAWLDRAPGRCFGADDAGQEQQVDLPRARSGRADREEPRVRDPQGIERHQPDRSGASGCGLGLGVAADRPLISAAIGCVGLRHDSVLRSVFQ